MATKWKSKRRVGVLALLFTFGLSGILLLINQGTFYAQKDYFHTPEFRYELDEFARYLSWFELHHISLQEAKGAITVTKEEINEHRYYYGDLPTQITNIKSQYEFLIQDALDTGSQQVADTYIAERDEKIADITKNFESDEYVEAKVVKEKEQELERYYQELESYRTNYSRYKDIFTYTFEGRNTGEVYTNIADEEQTEMLYVTNYDINSNDFYYPIPEKNTLVDRFFGAQQSFTGQIGVPKTLASSNPYMIRYKDYKTEQIIFWSIVAASILSLLISFYIMKKTIRLQLETGRLHTYYNKLPIDVRVVLMGITGIAAVIGMFFITDLDYALFHIGALVIAIISTSIFWALTFIQGKYLKDLDWKNLKNEWTNSILYKSQIALSKLLHEVVRNVREAFLNQNTGTQLFLVLGIVFGLGFSVISVLIHPLFVVLYIILISAVGLPLAMVLINRIGYFNRIVEKTNELAAGNLGQNLEVSGNSALTTLASNINLLKQGVKQSQTEQAKSEMLKTELITNVSHDLRTPLTSIITYTELLKIDDLSSEEGKAYIEIIDRKSQRLKVLIDDLFEVSKMASGNIELKKEKVDLVQLLQQALAEYDDTINDSNLQFRITKNENPVYAFVDGQKLWRVFDNLIGNILKYSLAYSRVYINLLTQDNQVTITFKNVSKYELNENSEELFDRFKRGDTSRNTEGSGLGLAIAQSIVDLHQGSLVIETDGDLFKVSISLRLAE